MPRLRTRVLASIGIPEPQIEAMVAVNAFEMAARRRLAETHGDDIASIRRVPLTLCVIALDEVGAEIGRETFGAPDPDGSFRTTLASLPPSEPQVMELRAVYDAHKAATGPPFAEWAAALQAAGLWNFADVNDCIGAVRRFGAPAGAARAASRVRRAGGAGRGERVTMTDAEGRPVAVGTMREFAATIDDAADAQRNLNAALASHDYQAAVDERGRAVFEEWVEGVHYDPGPTGSPIGGRVYRVVRNRRGNALNLSILTSRGWQSAGFQQRAGHSHTSVRSGHRIRFGTDSLITEQQAAEMGHASGRCAICGRHLSDPESVRHGIGPVCLARLRARSQRPADDPGIARDLTDADRFVAFAANRCPGSEGRCMLPQDHDGLHMHAPVTRCAARLHAPTDGVPRRCVLPHGHERTVGEGHVYVQFWNGARARQADRVRYNQARRGITVNVDVSAAAAALDPEQDAVILAAARSMAADPDTF